MHNLFFQHQNQALLAYYITVYKKSEPLVVLIDITRYTIRHVIVWIVKRTMCLNGNGDYCTLSEKDNMAQKG